MATARCPRHALCPRQKVQPPLLMPQAKKNEIIVHPMCSVGDASLLRDAWHWRLRDRDTNTPSLSRAWLLASSRGDPATMRFVTSRYAKAPQENPSEELRGMKGWVLPPGPVPCSPAGFVEIPCGFVGVCFCVGCKCCRLIKGHKAAPWLCATYLGVLLRVGARSELLKNTSDPVRRPGCLHQAVGALVVAEALSRRASHDAL